jgi:hypothetical protein
VGIIELMKKPIGKAEAISGLDVEVNEKRNVEDYMIFLIELLMDIWFIDSIVGKTGSKDVLHWIKIIDRRKYYESFKKNSNHRNDSILR